MHKKLTLPQKICRTCQRPFNWRKKWERDWDNIQYCSDGCRKKKNEKRRESESNK